MKNTNHDILPSSAVRDDTAALHGTRSELDLSMISPITASLALTSISSGVLVHRVIFNRGEWDLKAPQVALLYLLSAVSLAIIFSWSLDVDEPRSKQLSCSVIASLFTATLHIAGLLSSLLVFRLYQHPLRGFPGPTLARCSHFWVVGLTVKRWHLYEELQTLHLKYGDFVRIG